MSRRIIVWGLEKIIKNNFGKNTIWKENYTPDAIANLAYNYFHNENWRDISKLKQWLIKKIKGLQDSEDMIVLMPDEVNELIAEIENKK